MGGGGGGWVCKVILVFRFGPRLGLKTEDLGQAEQYHLSNTVLQDTQVQTRRVETSRHFTPLRLSTTTHLDVT